MPAMRFVYKRIIWATLKMERCNAQVFSGGDIGYCCDVCRPDYRQRPTGPGMMGGVTEQGNSFVRKLDFNRHNGFVQPEQ